MQIHLVLPGLLWPGAAARNFARDLPLPALSALLGHARVSLGLPQAPDAWLAKQFGLGPDAPLAALRRLGEATLPEPEPGTAWLCADPVRLQFAQQHLILADVTDLNLQAEEADALVAALNDTFPDVGRFEMATPDRWYLKLASPPQATFAPLSQVASRPVTPFLPTGPQAARWVRTMNEAQIVLHNHPLNQARDEAGLAIANSLWLWGAGTAGEGNLPRLAPPAPRILAEAPLPRGLARAAGVAPAAPVLPLGGPDTLVILEDLLRPALYLDLERWRQALLALEATWFAPLLAALQARRVSSLVISAPGDQATLEIRTARPRFWQFWRKPRNLEDLPLPPAP
ncbi:MAG: hypothetical protein RBS40_00905 [Rhodocyclaceae bacterium]|jgi:hypothetical protein|nr:hypothetical protein [Rhodocyclaceae bacterium]